MGVVGAAVGAEDALGRGAGGFEGDAALAQGPEEIGEVFLVEGDLPKETSSARRRKFYRCQRLSNLRPGHNAQFGEDPV